MLNSALMTLYEFGDHSALPRSEECRIMASASLDSMVGEVTALADWFDQHVCSAELDVLSPFLVYSVYKAGSILARRGGKPDDMNQAYGSLTRMLEHIGKRWQSGARYLKLLQEEWVAQTTDLTLQHHEAS